MHLIVGVLPALTVAASAFVAVRGFAGLFRKQRRAALTVLGAVGLLVAGVVLLTVAAYLLGPAKLDGSAIDPSQKARVLAEAISEPIHPSKPRS